MVICLPSFWHGALALAASEVAAVDPELLVHGVQQPDAEFLLAVLHRRLAFAVPEGDVAAFAPALVDRNGRPGPATQLAYRGDESPAVHGKKYIGQICPIRQGRTRKIGRAHV